METCRSFSSVTRGLGFRLLVPGPQMTYWDRGPLTCESLVTDALGAKNKKNKKEEEWVLESGAF